MWISHLYLHLEETRCESAAQGSRSKSSLMTFVLVLCVGEMDGCDKMDPCLVTFVRVQRARVATTRERKECLMACAHAILGLPIGFQLAMLLLIRFPICLSRHH